MGEPDDAEVTDPDEAFSLLADETRLAILRALWAAGDQSASVSALREAVGVRDSGRFNYHLGKLTPRFVRATEDGYRLEPAGRYVVGALLAGAYTRSPDVDSVGLSDPCPACGGRRTFRYDGAVRIDCESCDLETHFDAPPGIFATDDREEYPGVSERYARTIVAGVTNGFCPYCRGRVSPTVVRAAVLADEEPPEPFGDVPMARYDCERCDQEVAIDLGTALLDHPAVVAFYHEHGVDVRADPLWTFGAVTPERALFEADDPVRATVRFPAGGDALALTVDRALDVVETDR